MRKVRLKLQPQVGTAHPLLQEALSDDDAAEGQGHKHFRACGRVFKATIARADSDFYDDACFVVRYAASEPGGISRRAGIPAVRKPEMDMSPSPARSASHRSWRSLPEGRI